MNWGRCETVLCTLQNNKAWTKRPMCCGTCGGGGGGGACCSTLAYFVFILVFKCFYWSHWSSLVVTGRHWSSLVVTGLSEHVWIMCTDIQGSVLCLLLLCVMALQRPSLFFFFFSLARSLFVEQVRANLHIVVCMSPIGDDFTRRIRFFPGLVNCCTIDVSPTTSVVHLSMHANPPTHVAHPL